MPSKWMLLLVAAAMTALPLYLFLMEDWVAALLIGIPSFLIVVALYGCMRVLN